MTYDSNTSDLDAEFFSNWLKKMDKDVAAAFILSGLALDKERILEAFDTACQVMHIRSLEKSAQLQKELGLDSADLIGTLDPSGISVEEDTREFVKKIDGLIASVLESGKKKKSDLDK